MDEYPNQKPSRQYVARALPLASGGHLAQYAFPGVMPRYVTAEHVEPGQGDGNRKPRIFDTAEHAEDAARVALFEALNNRPSETRMRDRYRLMSGPDLADAVRACGITPTFACYLLGIPTARFFQWVDETTDKQGNPIAPPHMARLLLAMFQGLPGAIYLAESITEQVTTERKPRRETDTPLK